MMRRLFTLASSCVFLSVCLLSLSVLLRAEESFVDAPAKPGEPTRLDARKAYASALDWERHHSYDAAIDDYRKANRLEGGRCSECILHAERLAMQIGAFKDAIKTAREGLQFAVDDNERAAMNFMMGNALLEDGIRNKKTASFPEARDALKAALEKNPKLVQAHYLLGQSLAYLKDDVQARAEFQAFLDQDRKNPRLHPRAERFVEHIELARAAMAPPFAVTTLDGQRISMDGLAGKVVLIDFWATWCAPCRDSLPRIRRIAEKFQGQPLVVLSVSLDGDEAKWKDFVEKNKMTWAQYRDGGFGGRMAHWFSVTAIPATFSIDADGVLQDQHVGDAAIEGKLKKMVAQAIEMQKRTPAEDGEEHASGALSQK